MVEVITHDLLAARDLGHELGLQIVDEDSTPAKYSVVGGTGDPVHFNNIEEVLAHLESERKAALVYEDPFVVVYKHHFHTLMAINRDSRQWNGVTEAAGFRIYAHDHGALLTFGLDSSSWVLSGDLSGLIKAGVLDCRTQWAALHAHLNAAIEQPDNIIPYLATTDSYTISTGIRLFISSKWPRWEFGSAFVEMPVIQTSIPEFHYREELLQTGGGLLVAAVAMATMIKFESRFSIEECYQAVADRLKAHKVRTIILHDPQHLERHTNVHWMLEDLVTRAHSWGCKVLLVGSLEYCWHLRVEVKRFEFDLIAPSKPVSQDPNFFEELRQWVQSAGYTVELELTPEVGELIWHESGQDREKAIALCRAMAVYCNEREISKMDVVVLEKITKHATT